MTDRAIRNGRERRTALLERMADHLLAQGLARSTLRALAGAAGTSDRMLLYYFGDKEALLAALFEHVAGRLIELIALDDRRRPRRELLARLWASARSPALSPYMLLFLELAAAAGRHVEPERKAAATMATGFADWVGARLDMGDGDRRTAAMLLLAQLDGLFLLRASGLEAEADAALEEIVRGDPAA